MIRCLMGFLVLAFGICALEARSVSACHGRDACILDDGRRYHLLTLDEWDGVTPLPVLLHFHGWARTGEVVVTHARIAGATRRRGVLLVAPTGRNRSWDFWDADTDDVDFANAVLADVAKRFPLQNDRIYVSGYSYGSAMAWRYVCQSGNGVAALLAMADTLRQSTKCPEAPREVRHVHGLKDTVMDFPFGNNRDSHFAVALWRARLGCENAGSPRKWQAVEWLSLERTVWEDCRAGRVTLDTHPGGHFIPHGWIAWQLDELLGRPFSYP